MEKMPNNGERFLCIASYEKGKDFLSQLAALGVQPTLLTIDKLKDGDWPHDALEELVTMPANLTFEQLRNTVSWMARGRKFDRIIALDEFDLESVAGLREHLRLPGTNISTTAFYRDKLAMRTGARANGFLVPEFTGVFNYDDLRAFMARVPAPWLLKPRSEASAIGIRKIQNPEELWRALDELGDRQSHYLLEQFVPGEIYHVDSVLNEQSVLFAAAHKYGKPPMQVMHEGGVFTTRSLDRHTEENRELLEFNRRLAPSMGLRHGITHAEYIRAHADGRYYFLEIAARVGGAFISEVVEYSTGINLWREWARIEVALLREESYQVPHARELYAGSVLCLAQTAEPDTAGFNAPEIVYRMKKAHHAGLIVCSPDPGRVEDLLNEYSDAFADRYLASMPVPEKPSA